MTILEDYVKTALTGTRCLSSLVIGITHDLVFGVEHVPDLHVRYHAIPLKYRI